jgi:hypothetical protein
MIITGKGELKLSPPITPGQARTNTPMSVNVDILDSKDDPTAKSPYLRVTLQLSLPDDGKGQFSVQVGEAPLTGGYTTGVPAQGGRTATIPLLVYFNIVDLPAPTKATPGNFSEHTVFFNIDSANIGENVKQPNGKIGDQGRLLDEWVEGLKSKSPDVYEALKMGFLRLRGEARASKTLQGKQKDDPEVRDYNQKKSERRRAAVAERLKARISQLLDTTFIEANGITGATTEDESVTERRCQVLIRGDDLDRGLAKLKEFKTAGAGTP